MSFWSKSRRAPKVIINNCVILWPRIVDNLFIDPFVVEQSAPDDAGSATPIGFARNDFIYFVNVTQVDPSILLIVGMKGDIQVAKGIARGSGGRFGCIGDWPRVHLAIGEKAQSAGIFRKQGCAFIEKFDSPRSIQAFGKDLHFKGVVFGFRGRVGAVAVLFRTWLPGPG